MSVLGTENRVDRAAGTAATTQVPLIAVVGFDGSTTSRQALLAAAALINGREGRLDVVYVAHSPSMAALSAESEAGVQQGFVEIASELGGEVRDLLGHDEPRWSFTRRDGAVAHELVAAAKGVRGELGSDATVVLVVGSSVHAYHQVIGSVPVSLARQSEFTLLVVPEEPVEAPKD